MEALLPWGTIAESLDLHCAEEAFNLAAVQTPLRTPYPVAANQRRPDIARAAALQPALQKLAEDLAASPLNEVFGLTVRQPRSRGREQLLDEVFELHVRLVERFLSGKCGSL